MSIANQQANDKLTALRHRRKLAIEALQFEEAEQCDRLISQHAEEVTASRVRKILEDLNKDLTLLIDRHKRVDDGLHKYFEKQLATLRSEFRLEMEIISAKNEKEMAGLDESHDTALRREASREIPEQIDLLDGSKEAATAGDYDKAKFLLNEARRVAVAELRAREEQTTREFSQSRRMLQERQAESRRRKEAERREKEEQLRLDRDEQEAENRGRFLESVKSIRDRGDARCDALLCDDDVKTRAKENIQTRIDKILNADPWSFNAVHDGDTKGETIDSMTLSERDG